VAAMQWFLLGFGIGVLGGVFAGWAVLRRQIEKVRAAERRAQAAERMAEIGAMTSGLAHEIKNPLSTIGLNAQLLAEAIEELPVEADQKPRLVSRVKSLRRETDRLRGILTDFLEYAGQVRLDAHPTDVNTIVSELADFYQPEAQRQGVRIRTDLAKLPLVASVDARLLKQALLNLMINGTQAMAVAAGGDGAARNPAGSAGAGDLILRTCEDIDAEKRPVVEIHAIDTGPGIVPEVMTKLFTPYFTTKAGGSGLGLPTARRLIEEHGGRLDVHTELGKGSDFCVTLPLARPGARDGRSPT
jgi:signal transduction histidine kinase